MEHSDSKTRHFCASLSSNSESRLSTWVNYTFYLNKSESKDEVNKSTTTFLLQTQLEVSERLSLKLMNLM